jgi:hypothetical protein
MVMARKLYALLTTQPFRLPTNPGAAVVYVRSQLPGQPVNNTPLSRMEQASVDSLFNQHKAYFLLVQNIKRACFTALNASINDAFKVLNDPSVRGWHAGMSMRNILDQLSATYGQPTLGVLEANDHIFCSPTLAANAPKVLSRRIKDCAKKALLGQNPYTDKQLITNTIRLLLTTGLYTHAFEDWDQLADAAKTLIELLRMIQDAFQCCLNVTAPTAGHQRYAPALPFQQNVFSALANEDLDDDLAKTVMTQMAALTYQSQLMATMATNLSQRMDHYDQTIAQQQELLHQQQHQIMEQIAALSLNQSNAGRGIGRQGRGPSPPGAPFAPIQFGGITFEDVVDKDVCVDADADVAAAHPHLQLALPPLSCPLQRGGHQRLRQHTQQQVEGIIHPRQTPKHNHILTSQRGTQTGMLVTPVGSTWPMATPVRLAPATEGSQITMNTSRDKMPNIISMLGISVAQSSATRRCSQ